MKKIQGIADATIVLSHESQGRQRVLVSDGEGMVIMSTSSSNPAGMTPEQAREIADALNEAADRVENQNKERGAHGRFG